MIKQVRANYDAPTIEKEIQAAWKSNDAYLKTKALRENGEKFYFVDGPPYTTGHIHMGTALNKTIKDILLRYWRMKGLNVRDQPGYDMHGLPIEVQIEKMIKVPGRVNKDGKPDEVGVRSKKEIEEVIGIDNFVNTCREHALTLRASMTEEFKELGVWMDWDHPYQTLNREYVESAWWTIQRAYDRNLLDSSSRVVTWCPRCETALAEAEIEYWDETDPSVMIRMPLVDEPETSLLIWTTTPWTPKCISDLAKWLAAAPLVPVARYTVFFSHLSPKEAEAEMDGLRFDHRTRDRVVKLLSHLDDPCGRTPDTARPFLSGLGGEDALLLLDLRIAACLARATDRGEEEAAKSAVLALLAEEGECSSVADLAVSGRDLLALGLSAGKPLGLALRTLLSAVVEGRVKNEKQALLAYVEKYILNTNDKGDEHEQH